jgi:hypothetical protein
MRTSGIAAAGLMTLLVGLGLVGEARAQDASAEVTIEGRIPEDNSQEFEWLVTNRSSTPITRFKTQHFLGTVVVPPEGWVESAMTGNISRQQKRENGILEFTAGPGNPGIPPGREQAFRTRIHHTWSRYVVPRTVEVDFAGGRTVQVSGVLCPAKSPFLRENYPVVGLGAMFAIFLVVQAIRRRRRGRAETSAT